MEVLSQAQYKDYNYISRYSTFPYYYNRIDDNFVYGLTSQLNQDVKYEYHIVKNGDTLDSIALAWYNNPTYFWVIADFNQIQDPYKELEIGRKIKVPVFSNISYEG